MEASQTAWIQPQNVSRVAQLLLELDRSGIQEQFQGDMQSWVEALQKALERYHYGKELEQWITGWSFIDHLENRLTDLLECTRAVVSLLTPDAIEQLKMALAKKTQVTN